MDSGAHREDSNTSTALCTLSTTAMADMRLEGPRAKYFRPGV